MVDFSSEKNAVVIVDGGESDGERSASGHADGGGRTLKDASAAPHGQHHQQHQQVMIRSISYISWDALSLVNFHE